MYFTNPLPNLVCDGHNLRNVYIFSVRLTFLNHSSCPWISWTVFGILDVLQLQVLAEIAVRGSVFLYIALWNYFSILLNMNIYCYTVPDISVLSVDIYVDDDRSLLTYALMLHNEKKRKRNMCTDTQQIMSRSLQFSITYIWLCHLNCFNEISANQLGKCPYFVCTDGDIVQWISTYCVRIFTTLFGLVHCCYFKLVFKKVEGMVH